MRAATWLLLLLQAASSGALPVLSSARAPVALGDRRSLVGQARGLPSTAAAAAAAAASDDEQLYSVANNIMPWGTMPFAKVEATNQTLVVQEPALRALAALPAPICILSIAGPAHEGKSSWLNMFSHWLLARWETVGGAGQDFHVGGSIFDAGTEAAWIRFFSGKDGRPLPGTQCRSVALLDLPGTRSGLQIHHHHHHPPPEKGGGGAGGGAGSAPAGSSAHRLFALAAVSSSTVALNLMSPALNQIAQLGPMLG